MFSVLPNASKIAFVYLLEMLLDAGYVLLDTQYINSHTEQFGAVEIDKSDYLRKLRNALIVSPNPSQAFTTSSGKVIATSARDFNITLSSANSA